MKIGIIGLGSIGRRHASCLKQLGYKEVIALEIKEGQMRAIPEELEHIKMVYDEGEFYSLNIEGVIISNPTIYHINSMKIPLEKQLPIFVEKPLSNSLKELQEINKYDLSKIMVGFCLRYNDLINSIKNFIESRNLGRIFKANLYCGQYLPSWHPYADYRTEYYARKELGGGVLRTLSHEIDLMFYFFGNVKELCAVVDKISNLEIDVDDNVNIISKMENGIQVNIEIDYLNPISTRKGAIFGSEGLIEYDFSDLKVIYKDLEGNITEVYDGKHYEGSKMYVEQMKDFVSLIENKNNIRCKYEDGVNVMKVIKAAIDSNKNKSWVNL